MANAKKPKRQTFEEAIAELEATVTKLEQDDISLDESIGLFTKGVELSCLCNQILKDIEGRIVKLVEGADNEGTIVETPFENPGAVKEGQQIE